MMELSRKTLGLAAGIAATTIIGYCIYFDKKRRSDPDYKKKVRERRRKEAEATAATSKNSFPIPDRAALQEYFTQLIQMGETYMAKGEFEKGAHYFAKAILICAQPNTLLKALDDTLPPEVFALMIKKLKEEAKQAGLLNGDGMGLKFVASNSAGGIGSIPNPAINDLDYSISTNAMIDSLE